MLRNSDDLDSFRTTLNDVKVAEAKRKHQIPIIIIINKVDNDDDDMFHMQIVALKSCVSNLLFDLDMTRHTVEYVCISAVNIFTYRCVLLHCGES